MTDKAAFVRHQWRVSIWFFRLFPFWLVFIAAMNIWDDMEDGRPFDWQNVLFPVGMIGFAGVLYIFSRLIFKGVLRYAEYSDRRHP